VPVSVNHHVALRVADIERSGRFYIEAFGARWRTAVMLRDGPMADIVFGGIPGTRFKIAVLGFDDGCIELFEFLHPRAPTGPIPTDKAGLLHFTVQVDDVRAALERVERAGGARYWPDLLDYQMGFDVMYVTDPDGNIIELIDCSIDKLVQGFLDLDPANAPPE
jgi:catechol 2,3-dioxygenase-like lactoylglutathione lyase family enzyme